MFANFLSDARKDALVSGALLAGSHQTLTELETKTGISVGLLYRVLLRLEYTNVVASRWEHDDPQIKPRRRFYWLTRFTAPAPQDDK